MQTTVSSETVLASAEMPSLMRACISDLMRGWSCWVRRAEHCCVAVLFQRSLVAQWDIGCIVGYWLQGLFRFSGPAASIKHGLNEAWLPWLSQILFARQIKEEEIPSHERKARGVVEGGNFYLRVVVQHGASRNKKGRPLACPDEDVPCAAQEHWHKSDSCAGGRKEVATLGP